MSSIADNGIVTLADEAYFPGLLMMHRSVQEAWPVPVVCFDAGLSPAQLAVADAIPNLHIVALPDSELVIRAKAAFENGPTVGKVGKRVWLLWICPALIAAAPFKKVFWLDCDAFVLCDLGRLFDLLAEGPVFTPENNRPEVTPNKPELYDLLPISRAFDISQPRLNAGVSGWDLVRDAAPLAAYIDVALLACEDPRIASAISWHDQGALIWAVQNAGLDHRVVATSRWNLCARHTPAFPTAPDWDDHFLERLRYLCPEAAILHWNGLPTPWPKIS